MAGRGVRLSPISISSSSSSSHSINRAPPCSAVSSNNGRSSCVYTTQSKDTLSGGGGSATSGITRPDKTVCQYCGVSYLTMSEMKTLQGTVKEQEERLTHYRSMVEENSRLKETLENTRKSKLGDVKRTEEAFKKTQTLETQVDDLKKQLQESQAININLAQKYTIAADDYRQQEEVISQLRDQLEEYRDSQAENSTLQNKIHKLEDTLKKVVVQLKFREQQNASQDGTFSDALDEDTRKRLLLIGKQGQGNAGDSIANTIQVEMNNGRANKMAEDSASAQRLKKAGSGNKNASSIVAVEVHDLKRLNSFLTDKIRSISEEHSNCQDMHSFLRETVDKLKTDNMALHENINGLKVKFEEAVVELENLEAQLQGLQTENGRLRQTAHDLDDKLLSAWEKNKTLKMSQDPKAIERLQSNIANLQKKFEGQKVDIKKLASEYEKKLSESQRETTMEKERADSCLRAIVVEREDVEKRWEDRWSRHQLSLNEQLDSLKSSYEKTVFTAKELEETLQKDLRQVKDQFDQSKEEWESCRNALNEQIGKLKGKCGSRLTELENTRQSKIEIEVILQDKNVELESLHEMVREGCEERQELHKKIEQLEEHGDEIRRGNLQRRSSLCFSQPILKVTESAPAAMVSSLAGAETNSTKLSSKDKDVNPGPVQPAIANASTKSTKRNAGYVKAPLEPIQFTVGKGKVLLGSSSSSIHKEKHGHHNAVNQKKSVATSKSKKTKNSSTRSGSSSVSRKSK